MTGIPSQTPITQQYAFESPWATPTAQQLFGMRLTSENTLNLTNKAITKRIEEIFSRSDLDQLPEAGRKHVDRLREISIKQAEHRLQRAKDLEMVERWEMVQKVATAAGVVFSMALPVLSRFHSSFDFGDTVTTQIVPGVLMMAASRLGDLDTTRKVTEGKAEYYNRKHGLNNERAAILVALEPMLRELDATAPGVPQRAQPVTVPLSLFVNAVQPKVA